MLEWIAFWDGRSRARAGRRFERSCSCVAVKSERGRPRRLRRQNPSPFASRIEQRARVDQALAPELVYFSCRCESEATPRARPGTGRRRFPIFLPLLLWRIRHIWVEQIAEDLPAAGD